MNVRRLPTPSSLALLALAAACAAPEPPPAPAPPQRVESPALGIAVAALPAAFSVDEGATAELAFRAPGPGGEGVLGITTGSEMTGGINLVQEVWDRKAAFEGLPGGEYHGNLELVTPIGRAFTARGSWAADGGERVEEIWAYAIHPAANRLLTLVYRYPAGESGERMPQLVELIGEIEALPAAAPPVAE